MNSKSVETSLIHEFWCCKRELSNFLHYQALLQQGVDTTEIKVSCFTSYGNFLKHLYSFYEGIIKQRNPDLIKGLKKDKIGERISEILTDEAKKLITNKLMVITKGMYSGEPAVPKEFGTYLRYFRNWFSHVDERRIEHTDIDLFRFYKEYHYLAVGLFESADFSWSNRSNYDWNLIREFADNLKSFSPEQKVLDRGMDNSLKI